MRFDVINSFITKIDNLVIVFSLTKWHNAKKDMTSYWRNFGQWYGINVEIWEWISNFILHMTRHVITYPRWEQSKSMFVKGPQPYELTHFDPVALYGIGDLGQHRVRCWIAASLHQSIAHYNGVIMGTMASQITSLAIVYSTVYSGADQRKHQSSASLAFVRGIHRWPVNSPHKWPVTQKMFPFDDVIMWTNAMSVSKIRKKYYSSDAQVTFKLYGHFGRLQSTIPNKTNVTKYCFTEWNSKLPRSFEIRWVRQYLVNFTGLADIVNTTVNKTEPIFTGLGRGKLS